MKTQRNSITVLMDAISCNELSELSVFLTLSEGKKGCFYEEFEHFLTVLTVSQTSKRNRKILGNGNDYYSVNIDIKKLSELSELSEKGPVYSYFQAFRADGSRLTLSEILTELSD